MIFCRQCGTQFDEKTGFCPSCGTPVAQQAQQQAQQPQQPQPGVYNASYNAGYNNGYNAGALRESKWDGGVLETIGAGIVTSLLVSFTCGFGTPWAVCYMMRFIINHSLIDGKRLHFSGKGGDLFGKWILWTLLSVITCGIYSFWVTPKMYNWVTSHIHEEV